jgi:hypothetical protein
MQESAIATTQVLVHPIRIGIDDSPFPVFSFFALTNLAGTMVALAPNRFARSASVAMARYKP